MQRLQWLCDTIPALLTAVPETMMASKPLPEKWSKKEILGHLIDSAANNHQRFVRIQFEDTPTIKYDQDNWNAGSHYQSIDTGHLIRFWEIYNRHLIEVVKRIPGDRMQRLSFAGIAEPVTLQWLFDDYVVHMEHHLHDLVTYS